MSAPVDVLAVMRREADLANVYRVDAGVPILAAEAAADAAEALAAAAELIDFARASPCECLGPMPISTGATLPAAVCDRCKALTHAGVTP